MTNIIYWSRAFEKDYRGLSGPLQQLAEGAVRDLRNLIDAIPKAWRRERDYLEGFKKKILKIDVSGGFRLLAIDDGDITLWHVGDHDIMKKVKANSPDYPRDRSVLPERFLPGYRSRLFQPNSAFQDSPALYANFLAENSEEWIYQLGDEQQRVAQEMLSAVEAGWIEESRRIFALSGGPGTGKTAVLVWLLKALTDFDEHGLGLDVRLSMPNQVLGQIRKSTGWDLNRFLYEKTPDVVLIDDPRWIFEVETSVALYDDASIVVGFDPLQMASRVTDRELLDWMIQSNVDHLTLSSCYRQKSNVGRAAKHVFDAVAGSSPYLDSSKKERFSEETESITSMSNEMDFVNPGGIYKVVEDINDQDLQSWIESLEEQQIFGELWSHLTPLLVVVDDQLKLPEKLAKRIDQFSHDIVVFSESESVKGMDYQHCLMVLGRDLYKNISKGFEGSGKRSYEMFRLFRIPFSRPKDSLVVVVAGGIGQ